jgi:uncharacterized protein (TIGR03083 family)
MQLRPHYGGPPILTIEGPVDDQREPLLRQRRRLHGALAALTHDEWKRASRCEGWTVQDVVAHLISTNTFWATSIVAGRAGTPTRILAAFDPVATPALLVEPMRSMSPDEVLRQFTETNQSLFDAVESLDDQGWRALGESPVGHVSMRLLAHHALWDAWIHERDILLPLGLTPAEENDEISSCLRYVAAVAPVFALISDPRCRGSLLIDATDPATRFVVDVDATVSVRAGSTVEASATLTGSVVDLIEMLSLRTPFEHLLPPDSRWLVDGLATVFDTTLEHT